MSTTIVTQLTGEGGIDLTYQRFAVITVKEDDAEDRMYEGLIHVSQSGLEDEDGEIDEVETRAAISSELRAVGLQMTGLQMARFAWLGE